MASKVPLTVRQQIAAMRRAWPAFKCCRLEEQVIWVGPLQPAEWTSTHTVELHFWARRREEAGGASVRVLRPILKVTDTELSSVHMYRDGQLCLFNPNRKEWNAGQSVADTIVPWTSEWLYFYEVWLRTGSWLGGGDHGDAHLIDGQRKKK
jgi:hypothetical protein